MTQAPKQDILDFITSRDCNAGGKHAYFNPEVFGHLDVQQGDRPANDDADHLIDMAKAEALSLMGEAKKGLEFADRHI